MLHANLVSVFLQMQNSASLEVRAATPRALQAFPQLSVGQAVTATIVSQLAEGLSLADLGGKPIQLALPVTVVPGDVLSLRVLRAWPDVVFELLSRSAPTPSVASDPASTPLTTLSRGAQIIRLVLGEAPGGTAQPFAPPAARSSPQPSALSFPLLSPASSAQSSPASLRPSEPLTSPLPLLSSVPRAEPNAQPLPAHQLASALRTVVEHSGLFYESHLAAWTRGQRTTAELQREPQAQWRASAAAAATPVGGANPQPAQVSRAAAAFAREAAPDAARAPASNDPVHAQAYVLPEEARPLLRQQLEVLEARQIAWQGQVWPGQQATLTIAEEQGQDDPQGGDAAQQPTWRTTLDLVLAQLGGIHAELIACGDTVRISIDAPQPAAARLLQSGLPALDERLRTAGLQPLRLSATSRG